ncbi:hypothetical protein C8J57DRAFT_1717965 [Mycena rebaudengoi]|nr:hypothetical protein C8J57DRAFT_1717965 [Mycena rebaudengoi]
MPLYGVRVGRDVPPSPNLVPILIYRHIRALTSHLLPILHPLLPRSLLPPGFPPLPAPFIQSPSSPTPSLLLPWTVPFFSIECRTLAHTSFAFPRRSHLLPYGAVWLHSRVLVGGTGELSEACVVCSGGANTWALHRRIRRARVFTSSPPVPAPHLHTLRVSYIGRSAVFLATRTARLLARTACLLLAGTARPSRPLMIAQMQGQFQMAVVGGVGHDVRGVGLVCAHTLLHFPIFCNGTATSPPCTPHCYTPVSTARSPSRGVTAPIFFYRMTAPVELLLDFDVTSGCYSRHGSGD